MRKKLLVFLFAVIMLLGLSSQAFAADDPAYVDYSYDKNTVFLNTSEDNREFAFFDFFYPFDTSLTLTSEFDPLYKYELAKLPQIDTDTEELMVALSDLEKIYAPYFTFDVNDNGTDISVRHIFYDKYVTEGRGTREPTIRYTENAYTASFAIGSTDGTVDKDVYTSWTSKSTSSSEISTELAKQTIVVPDPGAASVTLAVAPTSIDGEIYVPVESFMAALGKTVNNDSADTGYISISSVDPAADQYPDIDGDDIYVGITADRAAYMDSVLDGTKESGHFWNAYYVGNADISDSNTSYTKTSTAINRILTYNVYVPADYDSGKLTFMLHGSTGNENAPFERANDRYENVIEDAAEDYDYIVLSPNGYTRGPQWARGVGEYSLWESFKLVKADYTVIDSYDDLTPNSNKVFITGNSAGGGGTINVAAKYPATFKAMAPTAPAGVTEGLFKDGKDDTLIANMPTYMASGTADITIPYTVQVDTYNILAKYIKNLTFEAVEQGHHSYAYASVITPIFDFFEKQLNNPPASDVASVYFQGTNANAIVTPKTGDPYEVTLSDPKYTSGKLMLKLDDLKNIFGNDMQVYKITAYNNKSDAATPTDVFAVRYLNKYINLKADSNFMRVGTAIHVGDTYSTGLGAPYSYVLDSSTLVDTRTLSVPTESIGETIYVPAAEFMALFGVDTAQGTDYAAIYRNDPAYVDYSYDKNTVCFNTNAKYMQTAFFDFFYPFDTTLLLESHDALYKYQLYKTPYMQGDVMMVALSDLQKIYAPYFNFTVVGDNVYVRHLFFDKVVTSGAGTRSPAIDYTQMAYDGLFTIGNTGADVTKLTYVKTDSSSAIANQLIASSATSTYTLGAAPVLNAQDGEIYVPVQSFLAAMGKTINTGSGYLAASSINPALSTTDVYLPPLTKTRVSYMDGVLNKTIKTGHFWNAYYVGTVQLTTKNMTTATTATEVNRILTYNLYIPKNYDANKPSKFTYELHGQTGNENAQFERASDRYPEVWENMADEYNYIVLSPNGWTKGPQWGRGVGEYSMQQSFALVDAEYNIDHTKMFIHGNSLGGAGVLNFGLKHSQDFAALAPMAPAPGRPSANDLVTAKALGSNLNIPIFMGFNNQDITVPYLGLVNWYKTDMLTGKDGAKLTNVTYQTIEEGHHSYGYASNLRQVFDFFERQLNKNYQPNTVTTAMFKDGKSIVAIENGSTASFSKSSIPAGAVLKDGKLMVSLDSLKAIYGPDFLFYNVSAYNNTSDALSPTEVIAVNYRNGYINIMLDSTFMRVGSALHIGDTKTGDTFISSGDSPDNTVFSVAPFEQNGKVYVSVTELMVAFGKVVTNSDGYIIISDEAPSDTDIKNAITKFNSTSGGGGSDGGTTTTTPEAAHGTAGHPALRIDGKVVDQTDTNIYIKDGRTMVPVRVITETMGYSVDYKVVDGVGTVTVTKGNTTVVLKIGQTTALVNGTPKTLDVAPEITGSRTYIPIRFLAEAFGYDVDWDGGNYVADIKSK